MPLPESEDFNSEFVRTVETFRCLYDAFLPEYNSRDEQERAWNIIAKKFSATVADCKVRWKYLRGGLTRYIKKLKEFSGVQDKQFKEFYMWKDMQFVIPYLKERNYTTSRVPTIRPIDSQQPYDQYEIKREIDDTEDSCSPRIAHSHSMETEIPSLSARGLKRTTETSELTDSFTTAHKSAKFETETDNPDLDFFKSILPDMAELNASQKRRFKLRVLMLLEDMSNEKNLAYPPTSVSPVHSSSST